MPSSSRNVIQKCKGACSDLVYYVHFALKHLLLSDAKMLKTTTYSSYRRLSGFSIKKYLKIKKMCEQEATELIKHKDKIMIGFVVYSSAMWFFDELFMLFENSGRFEPRIIIGHKTMNDRSSSEVEYENTLRFFTDKGYSFSSIEAIQCFDLLFFLTPYSFYEEALSLNTLRLSQLILHSSYSYMLSGNTEKLSLDMYHWSFRFYTDSQYYLDQIRTIPRYSGNGRYLGYPKMDQYYQAKSDRFSDKLTIIYAPHHSVNYTKFKSATFEENYRFFLELAKRYSDKVTWIYKPHPLLRDHCIQAHIFKDGNGYDSYVKELEETGSVIIANSGEYYSLFKASDAMITDSVSFLAEYQFTGKPLLLLMSGQEEYNDFGQSIVDILYSCPGNDFAAIESFLERTLRGEDPMKKKRELFFNENLDYYGTDGKSANKRIFEDIKNTFL